MNTLYQKNGELIHSSVGQVSPELDTLFSDFLIKSFVGSPTHIRSSFNFQILSHQVHLCGLYHRPKMTYHKTKEISQMLILKSDIKHYYKFLAKQ